METRAAITDQRTDLVERLVAYQEDHQLTDRGFAAVIGCPHTSWWAIRHGVYLPGPLALVRIANTIPELRDLALASLAALVPYTPVEPESEGADVERD